MASAATLASQHGRAPVHEDHLYAELEKTIYTLNSNPPVQIGDDTGFLGDASIEAVDELAQDALNRCSYDIGSLGAALYVGNELYQKQAGHALDDTQAALVSRDLPPD